MSQHGHDQDKESHRAHGNEWEGGRSGYRWGHTDDQEGRDENDRQHRPTIITIADLQERERTFAADADDNQPDIPSTQRTRAIEINEHVSIPPVSVPQPHITAVPIPQNAPLTSPPIPAPIPVIPGAYSYGRSPSAPPAPLGRYGPYYGYVEAPPAPPRRPFGHAPYVPQRVSFASLPQQVIPPASWRGSFASPPPPVIPPPPTIYGAGNSMPHPSSRSHSHGISVPHPPPISVSEIPPHIPGISRSYSPPHSSYPHGIQPSYGSYQPPGSISDGDSPRRRTSADSYRSMRTSSDDHVRQESTYVAVDPFKPSGTSIGPEVSLPVTQKYGDWGNALESAPPYVVYPYSRRRVVAISLIVDSIKISTTFLFNTLPRQLYLYFLLRLPSLYWSRVARIFEEAELAVPEIKKIAIANVRRGVDPMAVQSIWPQPARGSDLKVTWDAFIDSLLREWKTLNIISVLLLSAILTILQIESAAADPITRNTAVFSLICALMSLLYGCMYIIRFSSMKRIYKAAEWAHEAQKTKTFILWNVWVLLAMPAAWLAWSLLLYITCIMAFVWRTGTTGQDNVLLLSAYAERAIRISISAVLGLGVLYFVLILNTLRRYGDAMDRSFKARVTRWVKERELDRERNLEKDRTRPYYSETYPIHPASNYSDSRRPQPRSVSPVLNVDPGDHRTAAPPFPTSEPPFKAVKIMNMHFQARNHPPMPSFLIERDVNNEEWEKFIYEQSYVWDGPIPLYQRKPYNKNWPYPVRPQDAVAASIEEWNLRYFERRGLNVVACLEYHTLFPDSPAFALFLVDLKPSADGRPFTVRDRFGEVPEGLKRLDIFDQFKGDGTMPRIPGVMSLFSDDDPEVHNTGQGASIPADSESLRRSRSPGLHYPDGQSLPRWPTFRSRSPTVPTIYGPQRGSLSTVPEASEPSLRKESFDPWIHSEPSTDIPHSRSQPLSPTTHHRPDSLSPGSETSNSLRRKQCASSRTSSSDSFQSLPSDRSGSHSPRSEIPQRQLYPNEQSQHAMADNFLQQARTNGVINRLPEPSSNEHAFQPSDTGRGRDRKHRARMGRPPGETQTTIITPRSPSSQPLSGNTEGLANGSSRIPAMTSDSDSGILEGPWMRDHSSLRTLLVTELLQVDTAGIGPNNWRF